MSLRIPTPHGRPWSGAFNVVMATAIVSIAARQAGLQGISDVLLVAALLAFGPLAALDGVRLRHPITMLHRAGQPGRAFPALGFVADAAVLGTRVLTAAGPWRAIATILLIVGAIVWLAIAAELARRPVRVVSMRARAEWLLATVATEGLAILLAHLSSTLHWLAVALWALGGVLYVAVMARLARRLSRSPIRPHEFTPDWWIVMGAPAIFAAAAATLDRGGLSSPIGVFGLAGWAMASFWMPVLAAAELWRARTLLPRFRPERWTMVFPLGMYSASGQLGGHVLGLAWMHAISRDWLAVALTVWTAVAAGEIHYSFRPRR
ncbi:MAG: tellurite resistance/C4-dicarboxylate transporter family protein [Solirubrobacteraceae bacterium]